MEYISIFKPKLARHLLRNGFQIIDIKADKKNTMRTIFIFEKTGEILKFIYNFDK